RPLISSRRSSILCSPIPSADRRWAPPGAVSRDPTRPTSWRRGSSSWPTPGRPSGGSAIADPRPFVLKPDATVGDVLEQVRENGFGVVLGDDGEVLGTVDDGAVRRAALEHASLDLPVMTVMSGRPLVADGDERAADLLRSYRVRAVPVVRNGRLVEVRTLDEVPDA